MSRSKKQYPWKKILSGSSIEGGSGWEGQAHFLSRASKKTVRPRRIILAHSEPWGNFPCFRLCLIDPRDTLKNLRKLLILSFFTVKNRRDRLQKCMHVLFLLLSTKKNSLPRKKVILIFLPKIRGYFFFFFNFCLVILIFGPKIHPNLLVKLKFVTV